MPGIVAHPRAGRLGPWNPLTLVILVAVLVVALPSVGSLTLVRRRRRKPPCHRPDVESTPDPHSGEDVLAARRGADVAAPADAPGAELETPAAAGRLARLRARLARSQTALGRGLLALLSRDTLDEETWEEIEDTLLTADVGVGPTSELVERLRTQVRVARQRTPDGVRLLLRDELLALVGPDIDRSLRTATPTDARPSCSSSASTAPARRPRSASSPACSSPTAARCCSARPTRSAPPPPTSCRPGASGSGARPCAGRRAATRPASRSTRSAGREPEADVVLVDTAGRLHNKAGLMDELGKVKRVIEKQGPVDEVLLVLDATTGQNGLIQARVFAEVVDVTGIVLTKLDGTAKGGIVVAVQRELGVPVKLVGLGEGPDDLAPFEPEAFVDALLGD